MHTDYSLTHPFSSPTLCLKIWREQCHTQQRVPVAREKFKTKQTPNRSWRVDLHNSWYKISLEAGIVDWDSEELEKIMQGYMIASHLKNTEKNM